MIQIYLEKGRHCQPDSEKGGVPAVCLSLFWECQRTKPIKFPPPVSDCTDWDHALQSRPCLFYVCEHFSTEFSYIPVAAILFSFVFHVYVNVFINWGFSFTVVI